MLEQWTNKTKKYRLKYLENRKLITSHDVQFFEDETSSELTIVNINKPDIPSY